MLPETHIKRRYRSRVKTYLDPIREWPGFAAWLDEERKKRQVSIGHIARTLGLGYDGGTSYVRRVLHGKVIATPSTIRKVCKAIGISWPAAFANAGYYEELLAMMVDLVSLGEKWCVEDLVQPWGTRQQFFRSTGVQRIGDEMVWEAIKREPSCDRYHLGFWESDDPQWDWNAVASTSAGSELGKPIDIEPTAIVTTRHPVVLPKPMAAALMIAACGFPRRGDYYKDGAASYAAELLEVVSPLIEQAQAQRWTGKPGAISRKLPSLLQSASDVFGDSKLDIGTRRGIGAELVVEWADSVCQPYTYYARLAALKYWGELGSSESTATPYNRMPDLRPAVLPALSDFSMHSDNHD